MCLRNIWCCLLCLLTASPLAAQPPYFPGGAPAIIATPSPPWAPGQVVDFRITIRDFRFNFDRDGVTPDTTEFFHGLGILPGRCWLLLDYGQPPVKLTADYLGKWMLVKDTPPPSNCGGLRVAGYFFDCDQTTKALGTTIDVDDNPFNNFGDGENSGDWVFTWSAVMPDPPADNCDLSMSVYVFGDGDTGSWDVLPEGCENGSQPPNRLDPYQAYRGGFHIEGDGCVNLPLSVVPQETPDPDFTYQWDFDGATVLSGDGPGPYQLQWRTPGQKRIIRAKTFLPSKLTFRDTLVLVLGAMPTGQTLTLAKDLLCLGDSVQFTAKYAAELTPRFDAGGGGEVTPGIIPGVFFAKWPDVGAKKLKFWVEDGACASDTLTYTAQVIEQPVTRILSDKTELCANTIVNLSADAPQATATYQWRFPDANPLTAFNPGPHVVMWRKPGDFLVRLTADNGLCKASDSLSIRVWPTPILQVSADTTLCQGACHRVRAIVSSVDSSKLFWQTDTVLVDSSAAVQWVCPQSTRTYFVQAVSGACAGSLESTTVTVRRRPFVRLKELRVYYCKDSAGAQIETESFAENGGPLTYAWAPTEGLDDPFAQNPRARPTASMSYLVTATDSNGCESFAAGIYVDVVGPPIANAGPDLHTCPGDPPRSLNANVQGVGPFSLLWTPVVGLSCTDCLAPLVTTDVSLAYLLTAVDETTGCRSLQKEPAVVTYFVHPKPIADAGPDSVVLCKGESIVIGGDQTGGGPDYQGEWQPAAGLSDPTSLAPVARPSTTVVYSLVVTSNGCHSDPDFIKVIVMDAPIVTVSPNLVRFCKGDSAALSANASDALRWEWRPASGLSSDTVAAPSAAPDATTTYTVRAFNTDCASQPVTVQVIRHPAFEAQADASPDRSGMIVCGETPFASVRLPAKVIGEGGPFRYNWTRPDLLNAASILNPTAHLTEDARFVLTVTDIRTGCTDVDSLDVRVARPIDLKIRPADTSFCNGEAVTLQAVLLRKGDFTYAWTPSDFLSCTDCPDPVAKPKTSTTYLLTVREGPCADTKSVKLTLKTRPKADFIVSNDRGCEGMEVLFTNRSKDYQIASWAFGDGETSLETNPRHTFANVGRYQPYLLVTNGLCRDSMYLTDDIRVSRPPEAAFTSEPPPGDTLYTPDALVTFEHNALRYVSLLWDFGDGELSAEENPKHHYEHAGDYEVKLLATDENGCIDLAARKYYLVRTSDFGVIPNVFTPNSDGANDFFRVPYSGRGQVRLQIFDRQGVLVHSDKNEWDGSQRNGRPVTAGVYYYVVTADGKTRTGSLTLIR